VSLLSQASLLILIGVFQQLLSSTLSIQDELNMQKPWKIRSAGGFGDITWLPRTLHKVSVSQKTHENSYFLISNDG
jgi:hypothetical protein